MPSSKTPPSPDYAAETAWVSKPEELSKPVDTFYVYPTIYVEPEPANMDTTRADLRANARGLLRAQAGVYQPWSNLFAPFYRQQTAATQSMLSNNGGCDAYADPAFQLGAEDVLKAFDYYLQRLNPDRPFILAGHSQGSMVLIELLRRRLGTPELHQRLVAAYAIGYSVRECDIQECPQLALAQGEVDTGRVISYNTQAKNAGGSPVLLDGAVGINPLNWRRDSTPAPATANIKAVFFDDRAGTVREELKNFCGARLDTQSGALIVDIAKNPEQVDLEHMGRWPSGVFHRYDYAFFYENLKANVKKRIDAYLQSST